jgi:D-alanyl-D-alanine carboxypeptidase/D-alanyl-D-alanine-endopeptidase (penicillin-binding protein 4)
MPDAMMFNERISRIYVTPNKKSVVKKRADQSYKVVDNLQLVNKKCRGKYSWPQLKVDNSHEKPWLIFHGKISQKCGRRTISKVVTQPYKSLYYGLREALKKEGITLQGGLRLAPLPPRAKRFYTHFSDTLEKIVSTTAKKSNNLYARHLMLLLGAKCYGAPATLEKGRRAVKHTLESYGIVSKEPYFIDNGCGLSRKATLSARFLSSLFIHAFKHDGKRWMRTLSIAGVDGTIRKRFRGTKVAKHAWMKTGTLNHAKNIGGYVQSKEGKYYTVVILVNSKKGNWRASFLENEVIKWVRSYHTPKPTPSVVPKEKNVTQAPLSEALF